MTYRLLAIPGSLRKQSFNRRMLEAAVPLAPEGVEITVHPGLDDIPLFNEDLEAATDGTGPESVVDLREAVVTHHGLLIASPEYNRSIPGVLKNAVDWLSRQAPDNVMDGKPVAILGVTPGAWGTQLAQKELRHVLTAMGAHVLPAPNLFMARANSLFDGDELTNEKSAELLQKWLAAFVDWIERFSDTND